MPIFTEPQVRPAVEQAARLLDWASGRGDQNSRQRQTGDGAQAGRLSYA